MEFALILRELWARKGLLALGVVVAGLVSFLSVYRIDGFAVKRRSLQYSSASTVLLVDTPTSVLGDLKSEFVPLIDRAQVYANFLASPGVLDLIGERAGVKGAQLYAAGPVESLEPRTVQEPTALKRNVEITGESTPYRLSFTDSASSPSIGVFAQAPTTAMAERLANAAGAGLQEYIEQVQAQEKIPGTSRVVVRQLGAAHGGVVDGGFGRSLALLVFLGVLFLWCVMMIAFARLRESWRSSAELAAAPEGVPAVAGPGGGRATRRPPARVSATARIPARSPHPRMSLPGATRGRSPRWLSTTVSWPSSSTSSRGPASIRLPPPRSCTAALRARAPERSRMALSPRLPSAPRAATPWLPRSSSCSPSLQTRALGREARSMGACASARSRTVPAIAFRIRAGRCRGC